MNKFKTGRILKHSPAKRSRDKANDARNNRFQISGNSLGSKVATYSGGEQLQQTAVVATESSMDDLLEKFAGDANANPPNNQQMTAHLEVSVPVRFRPPDICENGGSGKVNARVHFSSSAPRSPSRVPANQPLFP